MGLSTVTCEVRHGGIDTIIGLSYSLALWIFVMHFEVFRGRASWEYLESLIQFLIGLTHAESPGFPLAASLNATLRFSEGCVAIRHPQLLLKSRRVRRSASIMPSGKCWFQVDQPTWLWLQSQPVLSSSDAWLTNCLPGSFWKLSPTLASASLASLTHREFTTPTLFHPAGSTWPTEAQLKTQEAFSLNFVGKDFYSISQFLNKTAKGGE